MKCTVCKKPIDIKRERAIHVANTLGGSFHFHPSCYQRWNDPKKKDFEDLSNS